MSRKERPAGDVSFLLFVSEAPRSPVFSVVAPKKFCFRT